MSIIVQKFGGSSLASVELIKKAAFRVKSEIDAGHQLVVVLSAMGGMTDQLMEKILEISTGYDRAEHDTILSAGEQISVGLMAMALQNLGIRARSFLGWQVPIMTTSGHGNAQIQDIPRDNLQHVLDKGEVAVVAGFQGLSPEGRITTLGRGGSDTTAVALAAALQAYRCDIYTDVEGVYTADPRLVSKASKLDSIAYNEMLELSAQGAKVLQRDSVELAMKHNLALRVLSSQSQRPGTLISMAAQDSASAIRGVAQSLHHSQFTLSCLPAEKLPIARAFITNAPLSPELINFHFSPSGAHFDLSFVVTDSEAEFTQIHIQENKKNLEFQNLFINKKLSKISTIGPSLSENPNLVQKLFHTLAEKGIQVEAVSTADVKVSVLIDRDHVEKALGALHTAFNLDVKDVQNDEFCSKEAG